jgi:hypothetical protein
MAVAAGRAHRLFVDVVFSMTVRARRWRLPMTLTGTVAALAFCFAVLSDQIEIGELMIEAVLIEAEDISVAPQMVCVAVPALLVADVRMPAVKPLACTDIKGNVFVAIEAKTPLRFLVKGLVTGGTFGLELGMTLSDRTRHYQGLEVLGLCYLT